MACIHRRCCQVVEENFTNCLPCVVEHLKNDDEPLSCRDRILDQLLQEIDCNIARYISVFEITENMLEHVLDAILNMYYKLNDIAMQRLVSQVVLKFYKHFSDDVVDVVFNFIDGICCTNHRNHIHILSFLVEVLPNMAMLQDKLTSSDSFIAYIISGISFPDDAIRKDLLDMCECLVSRCVLSSQSLHIFNHLPSCIIKLMFTSTSHPIMIASLHIVAVSAKSDCFLDWLISDFASGLEDQTFMQGNNAEGVSKLFAAMKGIFLLHEDSLNLPAILAINNLLRHEVLVQPLLDSDLAELIYDSLSASINEQTIMSTFDCVLLLAHHQEFFLSCHAVYGIKPVCSSLLHLLQDEAVQLTCVGFKVLQVLCDRQPCDVILLPTISLFDQFLQVITDGIATKNIAVVCHAMATSSSLLKHLPFPLPCKDLIALFKSMEQHLPNHFSDSVMGSSSQCKNEELLNFAQEVLAHLFEFVGKCLRLCVCNKDSQSGNYDELIELLLLAILKRWIPFMKVHSWSLCSPYVMKNCLMCVTNALEFSIPASESLWEYFINEGYIERVLVVKVQFQNDFKFRHFIDVINESLCKLSSPLLHFFGCDGGLSLLQTGYANIRGTADGMLNYLRETVFTSSGQIDKVILSSQCAVLMLLALCNWQRNQLSVFNNFQNLLDYHTQLHSEVEALPTILIILKFFLYCVGQQESSSPDFPSKLVDRLVKEDAYTLYHPAVISVTLRCSNQIITKEMKKNIIHRWFDQIDITQISCHSDSKHLVGLVLMNQQIALVALDAIVSTPEPNIFNKLVSLMTSAISELMDDDSFDPVSSGLRDALVQRLPEILQLDREQVAQAPIDSTLLQLKLLQTLLRKDLLSNDAVLYRPRILRKLILLLNNGINTSSSDHLDDGIVTSLLDAIELMLRQNTESRSINAELYMIFQNVEFLRILELLLSRPVKQFSFTSLHHYIFKLLSTLIRLEGNSTIKVQYTIRFDAEKLLEFVGGSWDQNLQCSVLLLWTSLFELRFLSTLFKFNQRNQRGKRFYTSKELSLAPLDYEFISKLFFFVLNCSAKGFPNIRMISLECIHAIVRFARLSDIDLYCALTSSPWLEFTLDPNQCENAAERELCLTIKTLVFS